MTGVRQSQPRRTTSNTTATTRTSSTASTTRTRETGTTRPATRTNSTPVAPPPEARTSVRFGSPAQQLARVLDKVGRNGFAGNTEVGVLTRQIGAISSKEELKASFNALRDELKGGLIITAENRGKLMNALMDKQQELGLTGRNAPIPMAVTEAVGEDIFGMGAINRPGLKDVITIANDGTVTARETTKLKSLFSKAANEYELAALHSAVGKLVNMNLVTRDDRVELSRAYGQALNRLTGEAIRSTRAMGEDTFGMDRDAMGLRGIDARWNTAVINGSLSHAEAAALARQVKDLHSGEALTAAFNQVRAELPEVKVELADRRVLAQAFATAAQKFDPNPLPVAMTRAMNEDMFGIGETASKTGSAAIKAGEDNAVTPREMTRLKGLINGITEGWQWEAAFDHIKTLVNGNAIAYEDRATLAQLLSRKGEEFQLSPRVTRAMNEDAFGIAN